MINIALDAMGGDNAPHDVILGACYALKELPIKITLVGNESVIQNYLKQFGYNTDDRIQIVHASEVVEMADSPSLSFRKKKDSSISVGLKLLQAKKVDGFLSAGNTGAVLAAATFILGRIPKVERPAVATILPSFSKSVVMLDMGTNVDCKPEHLSQFALMGHFFASLVLNIPTPRVGLLNIGEEEDKGNKLTLATLPQLRKLPINFIGNIEGKDVLSDKVDVVICDGFVGNNILKFGEGVYELFKNFLRKEARSSLISKLGLLILKPTFDRFKKRFDYTETGGAPLLGVKAPAFIAHGKSNHQAIMNALKTVHQCIVNKMVDKIEIAVSA